MREDKRASRGESVSLGWIPEEPSDSTLCVEEGRPVDFLGEA